MKGVIIKCLGDLVKGKFGEEKWKVILNDSGLNTEKAFLPIEDVGDDIAFKIITTTCEVLNISIMELAETFGDYWVNDFASKIYKVYFISSKCAKELLLKMDKIHEATTKSMTNAHPPRFEYVWTDDNTLVMRYLSHRGLIDFLIGLIKGVGKYYGENLQVIKLDNQNVKIIFK